MWIQDIFLDGYLDGPAGVENLALHGLLETGGVVRVDSPQAADLLSVSIGALLGDGELPRSIRRLVTRPCGGSLIARHESSAIDLCRMRRPDGTLEPRQRLDASESATPTDNLALLALHARERLGEAAWWSLFTDLMPAANRVVEWQRRGWWQRLAVVANDQKHTNGDTGRTAIDEDNFITVPTANAAPRTTLYNLVPHERGLLTRISVLDANHRPVTSLDGAPRSTIRDLEDQSEQAWWHDFLKKYDAWSEASAARAADTPGSYGDTPAASSAEESPEQFPSLSDLRLRESWLAARQRVEQYSHAIADQQERATRLRDELRAWGQACELKPLWDRCLAAESERAPEFVASQEGLARLKKTERRLQETRKALRELREAVAARAESQTVAPSLVAPVLVTHEPSPAAERALADLHQLLAEWPAIEQAAQNEAWQSGTMGIAERTHEEDAAFRRMLLESEASVASLITAVREASHRLRNTRHDLANLRFVRQHLEAFPQEQTTSANERPASPTATAAETLLKTGASDGASGDPSAASAAASLDERRESLHRQIRQLRDETQQLLARQVLSRHALLGIGLLFTTGTAVLLAAIFLDLDGAEMATGIIGLTCLMAAGLLKASFERAPSELLRRQRIRIVELLRELDQLPLPWQDYLREAGELHDSRRHAEDPSPASTAKAAHAANLRTATQPAVDGEELLRAEHACEAAWREWQLLLEEHQFAPETRAADVVRALRDQYRLTQAELRRAAENHPLRVATTEVDDWCDRAAVWWNTHRPAMRDFVAADELSAEEWLERLQEESIARQAAFHAGDGRSPLHVFADGDETLQADMANYEPDATDAALDAEIGELQLQVRQWKRRRQKLLDEAGVQQLEQYEAAILEWDRWQQSQVQTRQLRTELDARLATCGVEEPRVRDRLEKAVDVDGECRATKDRLDHLTAEIDATRTSLGEAARIVHDTLQERHGAPHEAASPSLASHRQPSHRLPPASASVCQLVGLVLEDVRIRRATQQRSQRITAQPAARATVPPLASHGFLLAPRPADGSSLLIPAITIAAETLQSGTAKPIVTERREIPLRPLLRATAWLRTLLQQPDLQLQVHASEESGLARIAWIDRHHGRRPLTQLAPSLQELTTVCLQLALAEELRKEAGSPPWIFTDRSLDQPDALAERLAARLHELAAEGQQVILVTQRERIVRASERQGFRPIEPQRTCIEMPAAEPTPGDTDPQTGAGTTTVTTARHQTIAAAFLHEEADASWPLDRRAVESPAVSAARPESHARNGSSARQAFLASELLRALAVQVAGESSQETRVERMRDVADEWTHWDSAKQADPMVEFTAEPSAAERPPHEPRTLEALTAEATAARYQIVEVNWDRAD